MDPDLSATTTTPEDPSAKSPSIQPMLGIVAWDTDGADHVGALGATTVAPGCDPFVTAAATSTCVGGVMTGYVVPAMVGAMSVVGSSIRPTVSSGIAAIAGYSIASEGAP